MAPAGRTSSAVTGALCAFLALALLVGVVAPAGAIPPPPPNPSDQQIQDSQGRAASSAAEVGRLSGLVSTTQGEITRLNDDLELKGELVKKAIIDQQLADQDALTAQTAATTAERNAQAAGSAIADAKTKAAAFAAASFRQGSVLGSMTALMDASSAADLLTRQQLLESISKSQLDVIATLQTSLSEKANLDSDARVARDQAVTAEAAAVQAAKTAQQAKQVASDAFIAGKTQLATLNALLDQQQNDYQLALSKVADLQDQRAQYNRWLAAKRAEEERLREEAIARAKAAAIAKAAAEKAAAEKAAAEARAAAAERARLQAAAAAAARAAAEQAAREQAAAAAAARAAKRAYDNEQAQLHAAAAAAAAAAAQQAANEQAANAARAIAAQASADQASAAASAAQASAAQQSAAQSASVYYPDCAAVVAAGAAPLYRGSPGYRSDLDSNGNGIACEVLSGGGNGGSAAPPAATDTPAPPPASPPQDAVPVSAPVASSGGWSASKGQAAVAAAEQWIGTPYSWGGGNSSGPTTGICGPDGAANDCNVVGFDCSGLTAYGWAQEGISLPNYSVYQYTLGQHVSTSDLLPGDLMFYANDTSDPSTIHHVTMYAGGGMMVEAPYSGAYVHVTSADFGNGYIGATRPGT